jgi:hypothetical protein
MLAKKRCRGQSRLAEVGQNHGHVIWRWKVTSGKWIGKSLWGCTKCGSTGMRRAEGLGRQCPQQATGHRKWVLKQCRGTGIPTAETPFREAASVSVTQVRSQQTVSGSRLHTTRAWPARPKQTPSRLQTGREKNSPWPCGTSSRTPRAGQYGSVGKGILLGLRVQCKNGADGEDPPAVPRARHSLDRPEDSCSEMDEWSTSEPGECWAEPPEHP